MNATVPEAAGDFKSGLVVDVGIYRWPSGNRWRHARHLLEVIGSALVTQPVGYHAKSRAGDAEPFHHVPKPPHRLQQRQSQVRFGREQRQPRPFVEINLLDAGGRLRH